jgi:hypothetical protein
MFSSVQLLYANKIIFFQKSKGISFSGVCIFLESLEQRTGKSQHLDPGLNSDKRYNVLILNSFLIMSTGQLGILLHAQLQNRHFTGEVFSFTWPWPLSCPSRCWTAATALWFPLCTAVLALFWCLSLLLNIQSAPYFLTFTDIKSDLNIFSINSHSSRFMKTLRLIWKCYAVIRQSSCSHFCGHFVSGCSNTVFPLSIHQW